MMSRLELRIPTVPGKTPGERVIEPEYAKFSIKALEVLEGYLQPDGTVSLEDATQRILTMLTTPDRSLMRERLNGLTQESKYSMGEYDPDHPQSPEVIQMLEQHGDETHNSMSSLVIETARRIPYDHPAQVKLVRLLSHLTPRADDAGHFWHNYYCRPLPVQRALQPYWHTEWFKDTHDEICKFQVDSGEPLPSEIEAEFSRHVNFHSFAAYMGQFKILDMTLMAMIAMRDCFEEDWDDPKVKDPGGVQWALQYDTKLDMPAVEARIKIRSSMVSAATMWILVNGSNLFTEMVHYPREISSKLHDDQYFKNGPFYDGPMVGIERWSFWRKGFERAAQGDEGRVDDTCARLAAKAAKGMQVLEDIMWH